MGFFRAVVNKVTSFFKPVVTAAKRAVSAAEKALTTGNPSDIKDAIQQIDNTINEVDKLIKMLEGPKKKKITTGALLSEIGQSVEDKIKGWKNDILSGKVTDIIIKGGKDFVIGTGYRLDSNLLFGTAFCTAGVRKEKIPNTIPSKAGMFVGDILSLIASGGEMAAGGGMEAGGFALDSTVALAPAGVMANAGGLVVAGDGLINARRSSKSLAEDLFSFASNGGNKGGSNPLDRPKGDFDHIKDVKQIEKKLGLGKNSYHPSGADGIKLDILADLNAKFPNEMKKLGTNPDLAFAKDGQIMIVSTKFKGKSFVTDLNINNYK